MMLGSKAHFAELAPAKVGLGPAGHEQVATKVADCECLGARELVRVERSASWDRVKIPFDLTITIIRKEALT